MSDNINKPSHYTDGKIEVIDFIEDKGLNFHLGNAVKYISRAGKKDPDKTVEDLKKAVWYIEREIRNLEKSEPKSQLFAKLKAAGMPTPVIREDRKVDPEKNEYFLDRIDDKTAHSLKLKLKAAYLGDDEMYISELIADIDRIGVNKFTFYKRIGELHPWSVDITWCNGQETTEILIPTKHNER